MIYIVIPVHNRRHYTQKCLQCLQKQTYPALKIIVVDDGSTDGTAEMVTAAFPEVVLLTGDGNLWWAEATNVGVRYALSHSQSVSDLLLTLNDDIEVDETYIATLLSVWQTYQPCLMGSAACDIEHSERLEYIGSRYEPNWAKGYNLAPNYGHSYAALLQTGAEVVTTDHLPGRGTLIPLEVFKKVGLFDAVNFRQYMADIEFSVRCRKAGYPLYVSVKSVVLEHVAATGIQIERKATLAQFIDGFFNTRSSSNLKVRYHFAMKHTNTKLLYFALDVGRIITGYALRRLKIMH